MYVKYQVSLFSYLYIIPIVLSSFLLCILGLQEHMQEELMVMYNKFSTVIKLNKALNKKISDAGIPIDSADVTDWEQVRNGNNCESYTHKHAQCY